jgi:SAM-dependent methyltransferase
MHENYYVRNFLNEKQMRDGRLMAIMEAAKNAEKGTTDRVEARLKQKHRIRHDWHVSFPFVPQHLTVEYIFGTVREVAGVKIDSFLDLGCGFGNKVYEAVSFGVKTAHGVELNDYYVEKARQLVPEAEFFHDDLLTWKPQRQYDLVYLYEPMFDPKLKKKCIDRVRKVFPKGQLVYWMEAADPFVADCRTWYEYVPDSRHLFRLV